MLARASGRGPVFLFVFIPGAGARAILCPARAISPEGSKRKGEKNPHQSGALHTAPCGFVKPKAFTDGHAGHFRPPPMAKRERWVEQGFASFRDWRLFDAAERRERKRAAAMTPCPPPTVPAPTVPAPTVPAPTVPAPTVPSFELPSREQLLPAWKAGHLACSGADACPPEPKSVVATAAQKAARRAAREARRQKRLDELELDIVDSDDLEAEALVEALAENGQEDGGLGSWEMEQILGTDEQALRVVDEDSVDEGFDEQTESLHSFPVQEQPVAVLDHVSTLPDDLLSAAGKGDEVPITTWLDNGGNVNARGEHRRIASWDIRHCGITLLMEASLHGNEKLVSMLLDRGAAVQLQDSEGNTALHMATYSGARNPWSAWPSGIVARLLQNGASDRYNFRGRTALQIAREDHCYSIERLILKAQGLTWISPYVFSARDGSARQLTRRMTLTSSSVLLAI